MKTALRWAVVIVLVAAASSAFARSPASNGCGDGEANVPFAGIAPAITELGGGSGEPGLGATGGMVAVTAPIARNPASNGAGDGEANVPFEGAAPAMGAEELGGGSGEPGGAAEDPAARAARELEFEHHVWTDP